MAIPTLPLLCGTIRIVTPALLVVLLASTQWPACAVEGKSPTAGEIDVQSSRVYIFVGKVGLGHEHAIIGQVKSGSVQLGATSEAGEIVIDMPTFAADTAAARKYLGLSGTTATATQKEVTSNMLGAAVLNVQKYPTATFNIASALPLDAKSKGGHPLYRLEGEFTLHGVKRPLKLDAEAIEQDNGVLLNGSFSIKQSDFGIKPFSKAFGAVGVTNELSIYGQILLSKMPATANRKGFRN